MVQALQPGTPLQGGKYVIKQVLGQGGFGNTYVATHTSFNETCAVKEFFMKGINERDEHSTMVRVSNSSNMADYEKQREKFKKEAMRLYRLTNQHIVKVHDLFDENGTTYYVMDYIDGESLKERLKRTGQPMSEAQVLDVLDQVLDALQTVHAKGLWHLDLTPANIMQDRGGTVRLIDFGASKQLDADKGGAMSTSAVTYTNGYAPREQIEMRYEIFGPWTDFYALGATLFNLLTGVHPPIPSEIDDDTTPDKRVALPMPSSVSQRMRDLVLWLMKTHRKERPQSVQQIRDAINRQALASDDDTEVADALDDETTRLPGDDAPPGTLEPPTKKKGKSLAMILGALATLCIVGAAIWAFNRSPQPSIETPIEVPADTVEVTQHKDTVELINAPTSRDEKLHPFFWKHGLAICAHFTAFGRGFAKKIDDMHNLYPQGFTLDDLNEVYGSKGQRWDRIYQQFKPMENLGGSINDLKELVRPQEWKYAEPELLSLIEQYASTPFDASSIQPVEERKPVEEPAK